MKASTKTKKELLVVYDVVGSFWEGLACARKSNLWLHIRRNGIPAYKQRYARVYSFSGGFAPAKMKGGKWLHIRHSGAPAYKRRFLYVGPFSHGLATACSELGTEFKIHPDGTQAD